MMDAIRSIEYYRDKAVVHATLCDMVVLPIDGGDIACYRYRIGLPDGRRMAVNLPQGHHLLWGSS
jgi:hypothetical protein